MKSRSIKLVAVFAVCFALLSFLKINDSLLLETVESRFDAPTGYERTSESKNSFGNFLRNLPLKPVGSLVKYYDGSLKKKPNVYDAVVDLAIGIKDLHQCADAVMRLRADYLFEQKQYNAIHFNFTNGFRVDYSRWKNGERIVVKGNKTSWKKTAQPSNSYATYWKYMEMIFNYAGTASLNKELKNREVADLQIGDVFIKGGFPGHAVIVVDVAVHSKTKKKIFLLAQSYMPAQEIQILKNPNDSSLSPWYSDDFGATLKTSEWTFKRSELKNF
jgi:Domain of unknown function (4846)